jgi:hypothetical protein
MSPRFLGPLAEQPAEGGVDVPGHAVDHMHYYQSRPVSGLEALARFHEREAQKVLPRPPIW